MACDPPNEHGDIPGATESSLEIECVEWDGKGGRNKREDCSVREGVLDEVTARQRPLRNRSGRETECGILCRIAYRKGRVAWRVVQ